VEFHIDKHVLLKPLDQVSKALPSKTAIEILNGILFRADDQGLTLTADNTSISIKAHIGLDDFEMVRQGAIVLPGKKIIEIVKKASDEISFEVNGQQVKIKSGKSKFELSGLDADEYPVFPEIIGRSVTLPGDLLRSLINRTIYATSEKESTPILTGVYFKFLENSVRLIGCDRHRLAMANSKIENEKELSVIVSNLCLSELLKIVDDKSEIELSLSPDKFTVKTKEFIFTSRVLEGTYPDVERLIPKEYSNAITVSKSKLLAAIDRVYIFAKEEKTNQIVVTISDEMEIEYKEGGSNAVESLEIIEKQGNGMKVAVNAKYVMEALKAIDTENVFIHFSEKQSPIVLTGSEKKDDIQLVLPYLMR